MGSYWVDVRNDPIANRTDRGSGDLVLVSRRNEPSPAVRRFVDIARTSGGLAHLHPVRAVWLFPETGRFSKKNREAIKHEPRNH
jgi:hypothetical protein